MNPNTEVAVSTTTTVFVLASLLFMLASCGKKVDTPPEPEATPVLQQGPTTDEQLSAMLRGHPNSQRICVDGNRERAFFLDYGPLLKPGEPQDDRYHGWIFIEKVNFYKTSNNTWFVANEGSEKYTQVYPDVTGLTCKTQ